MRAAVLSAALNSAEGDDLRARLGRVDRARGRMLVQALLCALGVSLLTGPRALAAPDCAGGRIAPQTLASTGDVLEYGIFDKLGRFFYSDQTTNMLMRVDHFGEAPKAVAAISAPGAMIVQRDGSIIIGSGDSFEHGLSGDMNPQSSLLLVNPETGQTQTYATGLGMANGIARGPLNTIYATNDGGNDIDRVHRGVVTHPWAEVFSSNGIVVSRTGYVYVSQTFTPAAIQRISIANPTQVTPYAVAETADASAGLDDMTMDRSGNIYVAANGGGQVWKVDTTGKICVLAGGLLTPSDVNFGVGTNRYNLYVVGFDGSISELPNVLPRR
jgi:sugar lactone lactonase YvrE